MRNNRYLDVNKYYFAVIIFFAFAIYSIFWGIPNNKKRTKIDYLKWHNAKINGHLIYVSSYRSTSLSSFLVKGDTNDYSGLFFSVGNNGYHQFQEFAKEGDSITKDVNCDTFVLIKNGVKHLYHKGKPANL